MPSARTSDMSAPAPRVTGVAISLPDTLPSFTRMNSSWPSEDATCLLSFAVIVSGTRGFQPQECVDQRFDEKSEGERRGDRISRDADHGFAFDDAEDHRLARFDGDAVDNDLARARRSRRR